ncbi:hypothetical protein STEG23_022273, partial [Scotinomys teguina]
DYFTFQLLLFSSAIIEGSRKNKASEDVLSKDAGECAICLEELQQGDTIARLPCLCIYHKGIFKRSTILFRKPVIFLRLLSREVDIMIFKLSYGSGTIRSYGFVGVGYGLVGGSVSLVGVGFEVSYAQDTAQCLSRLPVGCKM